MSKKPATTTCLALFLEARGVQERHCLVFWEFRLNRRDLRNTLTGLQTHGDARIRAESESTRNGLRPPKDVSRTETGSGVVRRAADAWTPGRHTMLMIYRGASDVAAKGAMFVITLAAARQLSRNDFGLFALASTLGWVGSVAADFGIQVHLARSVSQHPEQAAGLLRRWLPVRVTTGTTALGLSLLVLRALGLDSATTLPIVLFTLAYAASGLSEFLYYFFRGLDRTDLESTLILVQRGAMCMLALAALWWRPRVTPLALAMLAPAVVTLAAAGFMALRLSRAGPAPPMAVRTRREFMTGVAPIGLGILLSALYFRVDVFLLERWSGTSAVALYNAVFRLVEALRLFPAAVLAVALPALCRARDLRPVAHVAAPLTAAALGAASVLWLAGGWLVPALYGAAYADAIPAFRTLLLALPLMALNYALTHQLIGWHGQRAYAGICAGALTCNVLLNWRLIPVLGIGGAAWATVWTEAFMTLGCVVMLIQMEPGTSRSPTHGAGPAPLEVR